MAWSVYQPKNACRLARGQASISPAGSLRITVADLEAAGIDRDAVVEIDREELRISLRAPASKRDPTVRLAGKGGALQIGVKPVVRSLGMPLEHAVGRHPVEIGNGRCIVLLPRQAKKATPIRGGGA